MNFERERIDLNYLKVEVSIKTNDDALHNAITLVNRNRVEDRLNQKICVQYNFGGLGFSSVDSDKGIIPFSELRNDGFLFDTDIRKILLSIMFFDSLKEDMQTYKKLAAYLLEFLSININDIKELHYKKTLFNIPLMDDDLERFDHSYEDAHANDFKTYIIEKVYSLKEKEWKTEIRHVRYI